MLLRAFPLDARKSITYIQMKSNSQKHWHIGVVGSRNERKLDQEFLVVYFGGIIRIFREEIGGSW